MFRKLTKIANSRVLQRNRRIVRAPHATVRPLGGLGDYNRDQVEAALRLAGPQYDFKLRIMESTHDPQHLYVFASTCIIIDRANGGVRTNPSLVNYPYATVNDVARNEPADE